MPNDYYTEDTVEDHALNGRSVVFNSGNTPFADRSEAVQDIMSKMPSWIVRRGMVVLFVSMLVLFAGAYFIHYPDIITANVTIVSSNPPIKIVAQTNAKIQKIFVANNEQVKKNEAICLLENAASYDDVMSLRKVLARLDTSLQLSPVIRTISFDANIKLGELQSGYADLYQSVNKYLFFIRRDFITQKLEQLNSQVTYGSQLDRELKNKDVLLRQQLMLERKKFLADSSLVVEKVIAPLEFDNSKKDLITKQMDADATRTGVLQNKMQQTEYRKTITDLQQQQLQQENEMEHKVRDNVKRLQGQLDEWEQKYLLRSPVEGRVVFFKFWKENQYVTSGEATVVIVPLVQQYVARSMLPLNGAGKVLDGQRVLIKLNSFPFEEFGMVRGTVSAVSSVALDTAYAMDIRLTSGLITTTDKRISPQPELTGVAEIITNDKNILQRLFEKITLRRQ